MIGSFPGETIRDSAAVREVQRIHLEGITYDRLSQASRERLGWVNLSPNAWNIPGGSEDEKRMAQGIADLLIGTLTRKADTYPVRGHLGVACVNLSFGPRSSDVSQVVMCGSGDLSPQTLEVGRAYVVADANTLLEQRRAPFRL